MTAAAPDFEFVRCPAESCGVIANADRMGEYIDSDGAHVPHYRIVCLNGHKFFMTLDQVEAA